MKKTLLSLRACSLVVMLLTLIIKIPPKELTNPPGCFGYTIGTYYDRPDVSDPIQDPINPPA